MVFSKPKSALAVLAGVGTAAVVAVICYKRLYTNVPQRDHIGETPGETVVNSEAETKCEKEPYADKLKEPQEHVDDSAGPEEPENKVILLGLEGSGKTCLLAELAHDELPRRYEATKGFNVVCISTESSSLSVWEIGGSPQYRDYWKNFLNDTRLIVFTVDANDSGSYDAATLELSGLLQDDRLEGIPFIVVATKQDLAGAKSAEEMASILDVSSHDDRKVQFFGVNTKAGDAPESSNVTDLYKAMLDSMEISYD